MRLLRLEPWCFPPAVVARMTDYEVWFEYIAPQMKRQEAAEQARKGYPAENQNRAEPTREYMLMVMTSVLGMSKEDAVAEYERQKQMNDEMKARQNR